MNVTETTRSTRIAVFIDFDNIEIGVKNTIGGQFDIGLVLEAIKERGEIVTKIAYSDWKRAGDYSRHLTQHAIRMVQRNMTPGGDKNGADITMALDALEMCFTHDHINAFVIVGGDSDFISLVEKLKQYGRKVIVVGGRQFTSVTMQRNCHEFIAYENLVGSRGGARGGERGGRPSSSAAASDISKVLPLVQRALKVLSEREVAPQLGLLKSTLLQLDSTFSEREYGTGSFRDFMEKVAQTGAVTLKQAGRSMLVESRETGEVVAESPAPPAQEAPRAAADGSEGEAQDAVPAASMTMQEGIRAVQQAFFETATPPRFPMYVRQAKQYLRSTIEGFDERKYGFATIVDLLRAAGKDGVLRIERDRQGAVRVFPGAQASVRSAQPAAARSFDEAADGEEMPVEAVAEPVDAGAPVAAEAVNESPIVDGEMLDDVVDEPQPDVEPDGTPVRKAGQPRGGRAAKSAKGGRPARATKRAAAPGVMKEARVRKTARRKPAVPEDN